MADYTIGIDIGKSSIKAVLVSKSFKGGYRIAKTMAASLEDHAGMEAALAHLFGDESFRQLHCTVNFPIRSISFRHVKLPFTDRKKNQSDDCF